MRNGHKTRRRPLEKVRGRFIYLFAVLVLTLLSYPYLGLLKTRALSFVIFYVLIPLTGMHAVSYARKNLVFALFLGVPTVAFGIERLLGTRIVPEIVIQSVALVFYLFVTSVILAHILRRKKITADTLYGALCGYIMLGLTWVHAYRLVGSLVPGSFGGALGDASSGFQLIYFSFVTLTTLGYGDMTPVSAQAQSLAILEAMTGVLYVATLIARLVGVYSSGSPYEES